MGFRVPKYTARLSLDATVMQLPRRQRRRRWFAAKFLGRSDVSGNSKINNVASCHTIAGLTENHTRKRYVSSGEEDGAVNDREKKSSLFFSEISLQRCHTFKITVVAPIGDRVLCRSVSRAKRSVKTVRKTVINTRTPPSGKLKLTYRNNETRSRGRHREPLPRELLRPYLVSERSGPKIPISRSTLERQPPLIRFSDRRNHVARATSFRRQHVMQIAGTLAKVSVNSYRRRRGDRLFTSR